MPQQGSPTALWTLVLPVQRAERAKSRLLAPAGVEHPALARAIAMDCLAAVRSCPVVRHRIVVTRDEVVATAAAAAGDVVISDDDGPGAGPANATGPHHTGGLGAAVAAGLAHAGPLSGDGPVAVLLADLPALTPGDLQVALAAAGQHQLAFVPDADDSGTVLLAGHGRGPMPFAFGPGSAARHQGLGAARLDLELARLRRDVDTLQDLRAAAVLGLGAHTRMALATAHDPLSASASVDQGAPWH